MKKITLSLLSLLFAMFMFVACNNAPAPQETTEEATVEEVMDTVAVDTTVVVEEVVEEIVD